MEAVEEVLKEESGEIEVVTEAGGVGAALHNWVGVEVEDGVKVGGGGVGVEGIM